MSPLPDETPLRIDPLNLPSGTKVFEYPPIVRPMKGSGYESLRLTDAEVERIAEKVAERVFLALDRRDEAKRLMAQFHVGER